MSGAIKGRALLAAAVTLVVVIAVVAGFFAAGTPREARDRELDRRRIEDLRAIENAIDLHCTRTHRLPDSLEDLQARPYAPITLKDPLTKLPYGYEIVGENEYELCATFASVFDQDDAADYEKEWMHPAGEHCFHRVVDADR